MRRILTVIFGVVLVVSTTGAVWPTDHGNNLRSGYSTAVSAFKRFTPAFNKRLDGAVYGSPILVGTSIVVATENNTVYALDPATGATRWSHHLRAPISDTSVLACPGNISPTGITGTPAYDRATGRIFLVTVTNSRGHGVEHEIWGLKATTGATVMNRRVEVPGTDSKAEQQRPALAVDRGNVYIAFGGLAGDCGNYRGAVISLKTNGALGGKAYVVPTPREGAIWAAGGPVVAPNGNLFVAVGNGESTTKYDYSDSVTEISPAMKRVDYFAPRSWASDNANDRDLGSMTPAYTSAGYILQVGKPGTAYTVRIGRLGGIGGQVSSAAVCRAFGVSAVTGTTVYLPCTDGVTRVDVGSKGTIHKAWTAAGIPGSPVAGPGALYSLGGTRLYAVSGHTGRVISSIAVGSTTRFATPMLAGNRIYVGTLNGIVGANLS
jgi:outer membrane protein assembly factor BamB